MPGSWVDGAAGLAGSTGGEQGGFGEEGGKETGTGLYAGTGTAQGGKRLRCWGALASCWERPRGASFSPPYWDTAAGDQVVR